MLRALAVLIVLLPLRAVSAQVLRDPPASATQIPIVHDDGLLRAAAARYQSLRRTLRPEALRKLDAAGGAFLAAFARNPDTPDPERLARAAVARQFPGLTAQQADLLTFYVLAEFTQLAQDPAALGTRLGPGNAAITPRLQMTMQRESSLMTALGNILKTIADTENNSIQNVR